LTAHQADILATQLQESIKCTQSSHCYSVAQMYALTLNTPAAIMLGEDQLHWVIDQDNELQVYAERVCTDVHTLPKCF